MFKKSESPQNYFSQLQQLYGYSRDFRLLESLADAVVGHTSLKVYPFFDGMQRLLTEVRDEATVDSIVEHLAQVRSTAKTDVDRRAIDILELLVRRRAAELKNQPGEHVKAALAAMQHTFERPWATGEPRLMADLLANLGNISQAPLAAEQLRELAELHKRAPAGSYERLSFAERWSVALFNYSKWDDGIDRLQSGLDEFRTASGGRLPVEANNALSTFTGFMESRRHFARAEKLLLSELASHQPNPEDVALVAAASRLPCGAGPRGHRLAG